MIGGVPAGVSLPCPFCGSPPVGEIQQNAAKVYCSNEDCAADVGPWYSVKDGTGLAKATERWNTRTTPIPPIEGWDADVERLKQALEDVCDPLAYLKRKADSEGAQLSGMAYSIANDISTVQRIARAALQALGERP